MQSRTEELANIRMYLWDFCWRGMPCDRPVHDTAFCGRLLIGQSEEHSCFCVASFATSTNDFHKILYNGKRWRPTDAQSHLTQYAWAHFFFLFLIDLLSKEVKITCYFVVFFCVSDSNRVENFSNQRNILQFQMNWICLCMDNSTRRFPFFFFVF